MIWIYFGLILELKIYSRNEFTSTVNVTFFLEYIKFDCPTAAFLSGVCLQHYYHSEPEI